MHSSINQLLSGSILELFSVTFEYRNLQKFRIEKFCTIKLLQSLITFNSKSLKDSQNLWLLLEEKETYPFWLRKVPNSSPNPHQPNLFDATLWIWESYQSTAYFAALARYCCDPRLLRPVSVLQSWRSFLRLWLLQSQLDVVDSTPNQHRRWKGFP